jgi:lambda repressor-like predicted transcriptional regulator
VRHKIWSDRIPSSAIRIGGRSLHSRYRERILRSEFDNISLRYSYLIADAVGVDVEVKASA